MSLEHGFPSAYRRGRHRQKTTEEPPNTRPIPDHPPNSPIPRQAPSSGNMGRLGDLTSPSITRTATQYPDRHLPQARWGDWEILLHPRSQGRSPNTQTGTFLRQDGATGKSCFTLDHKDGHPFIRFPLHRPIPNRRPIPGQFQTGTFHREYE